MLLGPLGMKLSAGLPLPRGLKLALAPPVSFSLEMSTTPLYARLVALAWTLLLDRAAKRTRLAGVSGVL